jgi:enamine deaminase RidA (YjgF/YER057c/UK114 family)
VSGRVQQITPEGWARGTGYAHGTAGRGRIICTAGQVGWDPGTQQFASADFATQAAQALGNVAAVLRAAGASAEHLVRMTWFISDRQAYLDARAAIGVAYREHFGRHFPAMSVVVVAALLDPGALVEIEATAIVPE